METEYIGGVPAELFAGTNFSGTKTSQSGSLLDCFVDIDGPKNFGMISIQDTGSDDYGFDANVAENGNLAFEIATAQFIETANGFQITYRHPDFHAALLARAAIDAFISNGIAIHGLVINWGLDENGQNKNLNLAMYEKARREKKTIEQAIFSTWTGRIIARGMLGFTKVKFFDDSFNGRDIRALLVSP